MKLSETVLFDDSRDFVYVDGVAITGDLLRALITPTPPGVWFRVIKRHDGVVTFERTTMELATQ